MSYVDTIIGKELMPATESLSVYRAQRVMLGVPKIIMKMGTRGPQNLMTPATEKWGHPLSRGRKSAHPGAMNMNSTNCTIIVPHRRSDIINYVI